MKMVVISDTHDQHQDLILPYGDILVHAGDISRGGTKKQVMDFLEWFAEQPHSYKIFIAGNHDFFFEQADPAEISTIIPKNVIYLNDSAVEINGIKFWGSPITPWFHSWAFNRHRGAEIKQHWDLIPDDIDILVTHGPPFGILDKTVYGNSTGCEELLMRVYQVKPKYHIYGHIHEDYGSFIKGGTTFINASVLDDRYEMKNKPKVFEL